MPGTCLQRPGGHGLTLGTGSLYVVSTPIGNLEDITQRALRVLQESALIAAEDTRRTQHLLFHFGISTRLISYHDHSPPSRLEKILEQLTCGKDVALVSDAGTPGISDPGYALVGAAISRGIPVVPIPGASALLAALSASGLPTNAFVFEGFLPRQRSARRERLHRLKAETRTVVLFEAPQRLHATLAELYSVLGDRDVVVARELTKLHEEFWRGTLVESLDRWEEGVRGEVVIALAGRPDPLPDGVSCLVEPGSSDTAPAMLIAQRIAAGMSRKDAARDAARETGMPYREAYRLAAELGSVDVSPH